MPVHDVRELRRYLSDRETWNSIEAFATTAMDVLNHNFRHDFSKRRQLLNDWLALLKKIREGQPTVLNDEQVGLLTNEKSFEKELRLDIKLEMTKGAGAGATEGDFCGYRNIDELYDATHIYFPYTYSLVYHFFPEISKLVDKDRDKRPPTRGV